MKKWLLSWNAERWAWDDKLNGYKELIEDIRQEGHAFCKWTCGVNKSIQKGDRVFLIKLGSNPRGIVASGYAATGVFEGTHWDIDKARKGKKARRIFVDFDKILDYDMHSILEMNSLKEISSEYHWSTQASGIEIPENIAIKIEQLWDKL